PVVPVVANVTATAVRDPAEIKDLLVQQVTGLVRWRECVLYMKGQGVSALVEVGSGRVLSGLAKRIDREMTGQSLGTPAEIEAFLKTL
ncbi:MAG: ACP S-malonyltransferase, partial [Stellaceae bacterium]